MEECPGCSKKLSGSHEECPYCGLIFSRWQEVINREPVISTPVSVKQSGWQPYKKSLVMGGAMVSIFILHLIATRKPAKPKIAEPAAPVEKKVDSSSPTLIKFNALNRAEQESLLQRALLDGFHVLETSDGATISQMFEGHSYLLFERLNQLLREEEDYNARLPRDGRTVHHTSNADYPVVMKRSRDINECFAVAERIPKFPNPVKDQICGLLKLRTSFHHHEFTQLMKVEMTPDEKAEVLSELLRDFDSGTRIGAMRALAAMKGNAAAALPRMKSLQEEISKPRVTVKNPVGRINGKVIIAKVHNDGFLQSEDVAALNYGDYDKQELKKAIEAIEKALERT